MIVLFVIKNEIEKIISVSVPYTHDILKLTGYDVYVIMQSVFHLYNDVIAIYN